MAEEAGLDENAYLNGLVEYLGENLSRPVTMLVGKRCRISALLQDHTGMPVCFVPFRDFEAKRTSISTRKKCRCPMRYGFVQEES